jgi:myo-inositol-1(or 4)-monophosphatase
MSDISEEQLDEVYAFAVELGKQAGQMLMDVVNARIAGGNASPNDAHVEKENAVDIVTQTDLDVEKFIKNAIAKKYPVHKSVLLLRIYVGLLSHIRC